MSTLPKISVPTYQVDLSRQKVTFRPFLVREEKLLLIALESEDNKQIVDALVTVLNDCVTESINVRSLPLFDVMNLMVHLRMKSKGESVDAGLNCLKCKETNKITLDLESAEVTGTAKNNMKIEFAENVGIIMQYPTIEIFNSPLDLSTVEGQFDVLLKCIESIYDANTTFSAKDQTAAELQSFVDDLPEQYLEQMLEFLHEVPKLKLDVEFECTECKEVNKTEVTDFMNFLA